MDRLWSLLCTVHTQRCRREGRSGATCSAAFRGAKRGGDRLLTVPLECKHNVQTHRAGDIDTGRSTKKAPSPVYVDDAFDAWSSDQSDAGATIA